jgi:FG-GAP-like repeat
LLSIPGLKTKTEDLKRIRNFLVKPFKQSLLFVCLAVFFIMVCSGMRDPVRGDDSTTRILILPFQIHAAKDMVYMEKAISDMLSSRLEKPGRVSVINETIHSSNISEMTALLEKHNADLVVTGSMTFMGNEVSTDARVFETGNPSPLIVFHAYGNTSDGVLAHIERLARKIDTQLLTADGAGSLKSLSDQAETPVVSAESAFAWHSQKLKFPVVGMSAGDLDGDGQLEWVLAGEDTVYIYAMQKDALVLEASIPQKNNTIIGVDVVDVDGNQRAEIFVTRKRRDDRIDSSVLEWNGHAYEELQSGLKWFFRAVPDQQHRMMLLGQKQGHVNSFRTGPTGRNLFEPEIYRFKREQGAYTPGNALNHPKDINIYWLGSGDVMGTDSLQTVLLGPKDILTLISGDGTEEWSSSEPYGGSNVYLDTQAGGVNVNSNETDRHFLSQRVHVRDMNGDTRDDVIVSRNKDAGGRLFKKFRNYKNGSVTVLSWQETNLEIVWETKEHAGYISDTWMVDVTRDGKPELAYCLVTHSGSLGGQQTSRMYIQEIPDF